MPEWEPEWAEVVNDLEFYGMAMRCRIGDYIAVVKTITPSPSTQYRNRRWVVYWKHEELGHVLACGCCNGSASAQHLALEVIGRKS